MFHQLKAVLRAVTRRPIARRRDEAVRPTRVGELLDEPFDRSR